MIAALYVQTGGCYFNLPDVEPWDEARDARKYAGPWPVVAHPPCQLSPITLCGKQLRDNRNGRIGDVAGRVRSEKERLADKAYREANRDKINAKSAAWKAANPDKVKAIQRAYKQRNAAKIAEVKRAWRKANPEKHRAANQRWQMNRRMKKCDFDAMLDAQGGRCAICRTDKAFSGGGDGRRLAIDHCHSTGVVRGLLCGNCNRMLGLVKDDPEVLRRAAVYLEVSR
jgi:hypothetical protein